MEVFAVSAMSPFIAKDNKQNLSLITFSLISLPHTDIGKNELFVAFWTN